MPDIVRIDRLQLFQDSVLFWMVHCRGKFVDMIFHVNSDNERDVGYEFFVNNYLLLFF